MEKLTKVLKKNGELDFGNAILDNLENLGLGILSKADFEAFMFHQLTLCVNPHKVKDNYDWMRLLKVTPTKLRSLQMTRSAKFLNLDLDNSDNWKLIFIALDGKKIETEDKENGKVKIYIDDVHIHRLIERFVVDGGSSVDYTLNRNQLVLKYTEFLYLVDNVLLHAKKKPLLEALNQDRSSLKVEKEFEKLESVFKELKDAIKDEAYSEIAKGAISTIIKIARKQLGI